MAITYNPYNWEIRKKEDEDIKSKIKAIQNTTIESLNNLDDYEFYNHKSMSGMLLDIYTSQVEINELWIKLEEKGFFDTRPMYSESFRD